MRSVKLPGGNAETTCLGFGCASLQEGQTHLLDAAYDAGIRHFDVAPSYGRGLTESYLGQFLQRRRATVTVATKYGIRPPIRSRGTRLARTLLRPIVRRLRAVPALDSQISRAETSFYSRAPFTAEDARKSLETSLRQLKRDRIDLFLMHEAMPADLADEGLLRFLQEAVGSGKIGRFGVGGEAAHISDLLASCPSFCDVLQHPWSPFQPRSEAPRTFFVAYRILDDGYRRLKARLASDRPLRERWSDQIQTDLSAPGVLERLMFRAAVDGRPESLILFSSAKPRNILDNVEAASDPALSPAASSLVQLVRSANLSD